MLLTPTDLKSSLGSLAENLDALFNPPETDADLGFEPASLKL